MKLKTALKEIDLSIIFLKMIFAEIIFEMQPSCRFRVEKKIGFWDLRSYRSRVIIRSVETATILHPKRLTIMA